MHAKELAKTFFKKLEDIVLKSYTFASPNKKGSFINTHFRYTKG